MRIVQSNETVVAWLVERLNTRLGDYITAINALPDALVQLDGPAKILRHVPPLDQIVEFPTIGVGDADGRWEDDNGSSATGVDGQAIVWVLQDADQEQLTDKARAAMRALLSCVMDRAEWKGEENAPWSLNLKRKQPGAALADRPGPNQTPTAYITWVGIIVEARYDAY